MIAACEMTRMAGSPALLKQTLVHLQVTIGEQGLLTVLLINPGRPSTFSLPWQKVGFSLSVLANLGDCIYLHASTALKSLQSSHVTLWPMADVATVLEIVKLILVSFIFLKTCHRTFSVPFVFWNNDQEFLVLVHHIYLGIEKSENNVL